MSKARTKKGVVEPGTCGEVSQIPTGATVSGLIRAKLGTHTTTRAEIERTTGMNRVALWTILRGGKPPLKREGHLPARHDPRYTALAKHLGVDIMSFIELVEREQSAGSAPTRLSAFVDGDAFSKVWVVFVSSAEMREAAVLPHLGYLHGAFFACAQNEQYLRPRGVDIPPPEVSRSTLALLAQTVHSCGILEPSRAVELAARIYKLIT